jgi:ligand-binding SRPBCC domain-containing protein
MPYPFSFHWTQDLPAPPDELFAFLRNPRNVGLIMPPSMNVEVDWPEGKLLELGSKFRSRFRKNGIPLKWTSEVVDFDEGRMFADAQLHGPFRQWLHRHVVEPLPNGLTRLHDYLIIELPFGPLGALAMRLAVRRDLEQTFEHRKARMEELFGKP